MGPDDRQIRLLREHAKRVGVSLVGMSRSDAADTLEALALILPMADADALAEQAAHAATLIREGERECRKFLHQLSEL